MAKKNEPVRRDELKIPTGMPEHFTPTADSGLTAAEAERRKAAGQGNAATVDPGKTTAQVIVSHVFTLFNLLNVALAVCLALVGSWRNMAFMGVVVSNTLIGIIQEMRSRATIRRLQLLNMPSCHVLRDGKDITLRADELVKDDLIVLHGGDQVPADAIVRGGAGSVNESLLTGESDAIGKRESDWLMSGSYLTEGRLVAQLVYVGNDSYINRLSGEARAIRPPESELKNDLNRLLRFVSILLVPIGILLFCKQHFLQGLAMKAAVPSSVAAMIGMIPEGLLLLTSVSLAVGVITLGRKQTLVQELHGIETLARVDVLCLDKTGTLTTGGMTVHSLEPQPGTDEARLKESLSALLGCFDVTGGTMAALARAVPAEKQTPMAVIPFSSARKLSAATLSGGRTLVLGAPTFVLTPEKYRQTVAARVEEAAAAGLRVLVLAECDGAIDGETLPPVTRVLGLTLLEDTLRENCAETLAFFREQGVDVRVISGDDPRTVSAIAGRAGVEGHDRWVDATTLDTPERLAEAAANVKVFGRVTPARKRELVDALKAAGHHVAMTGDGVNDIPAMKAADCSIAMAGGSDACKHAAQITLLSSDFACMPAVVNEGRRVVNNITRAASLFLVKTLYSFALGLLTLFLPMVYPFQGIQLTLVSTLTIGAPTFVLALQPNHDRLKGSFLKTVLRNAVPGALAVSLIATVCMVL